MTPMIVKRYVTAATQSQPTEASIAARVIRCRCEDRSPHTTDAAWENHWRLAASEDRGQVSYWHKNPLRRWLWTMKQAWKEGCDARS